MSFICAFNLFSSVSSRILLFAYVASLLVNRTAYILIYFRVSFLVFRASFVERASPFALCLCWGFPVIISLSGYSVVSRSRAVALGRASACVVYFGDLSIEAITLSHYVSKLAIITDCQ